MPFLPFSRRSRVIRRGGIAAGIAVITVISVGLAMPSTSAAPARPAGASQVSPSTLVREWLAALGPANQNLPKIEAALKALPITATDAQVEEIVAPVAGLVKPIEALLPSRRPVHVASTSLEALATPTFSSPSGCGSGSYTSVSGGAKLVMGGQTYSNGFQFATDGSNCVDNWTWHIGGLFKTFRAIIGLDVTNTTAGSISFLGPNGKPLSFRAGNKAVTILNLVSGVPTNVVLSVAHDQNFIIVTSGTSGGSSTVDFANDALTA
jgi:hypothetical protein